MNWLAYIGLMVVMAVIVITPLAIVRAYEADTAWAIARTALVSLSTLLVWKRLTGRWMP